MQSLVFYKILDKQVQLSYYNANRITHSYRERWRDRPCETRQPSLAMVLNPARRFLIDERKAEAESSALSSERAFFVEPTEPR